MDTVYDILYKLSKNNLLGLQQAMLCSIKIGVFFTILGYETLFRPVCDLPYWFKVA